MAAGASTDATVAPQTQSELPVDNMNAPQTANGSGIDSASNAGEKRSQEPGASWRAGEQQVLPQNRLFIVVFALMLTTFLAALDQVCLYFAPSLTVCSASVSSGPLTKLMSLDHCGDCTSNDRRQAGRWK